MRINNKAKRRKAPSASRLYRQWGIRPWFGLLMLGWGAGLLMVFLVADGPVWADCWLAMGILWIAVIMRWGWSFPAFAAAERTALAFKSYTSDPDEIWTLPQTIAPKDRSFLLGLSYLIPGLADQVQIQAVVNEAGQRVLRIEFYPAPRGWRRWHQRRLTIDHPIGAPRRDDATKAP